jgi:hypothetical protein
MKKHFEELKHLYGDVLVFNLVNTNGYEFPVGDTFTRAVTELNDPRIKYV